MKTWFERGAWASSKGKTALRDIQPENVKRIAVIRHAALGDMVLVRPFLVEVRKFFPNAEIVLSLVSNYIYGAPIDLVDSVHIVQGSQEKNVSLRERIVRIKELGQVDILFDLADTTRSRYICLISKAKIKIGFPYKSLLRNLLFDLSVPRSDFTFEGEAMLHPLMLLGANPKLPLDYAWPTDVMCNSNQKSNRSIIYFPFASVNSKCWPIQNFCNLIHKVASLHPNFQHIILAGVGKHEQTNNFEYLTKVHKNVSLQPVLSLEDTTKFLARASVVVSNDTGIRNLAISLDTPTLGVFFSTVPFRYWPRGLCHQVVFNAEGDIPSVENVQSTLSDMLNNQI